MRLGSHCGGGARVCMHWDSWGVCRGGRSESGWVRIGGSLTVVSHTALTQLLAGSCVRKRSDQCANGVAKSTD